MNRLFRSTLSCLLTLPLLFGSFSMPVFANSIPPVPGEGLVIIEDEPIPASNLTVRWPDDKLISMGSITFPNHETVPAGAPGFGPLPGVPAASAEFRGLWVASVANIDWPKIPTTDAAVLKAEAISTLEFARTHRFNAIFLQIRPTADSFFPSDIFPWSQYLTGWQGLAPSDGFDPLAFWIAEAHARGLELHAWLNPYRITKRKPTDPSATVDQLTTGHPAKLHPEWVVTHSDGNLYFNPGLPEVRRLLLDSVSEILTKYPVDGIHFDDYFYPDGSANNNTSLNSAPVASAAVSAETERRGFIKDKNDQISYISTFDDSAAFTQYGGSFAKLDDWRRSNVDAFVKDVSTLIRSHASRVRFGISPFGIWRNQENDAQGSDTNGSDSFTQHAADTRKWVKEGLVDYIAPQLYWNTGYKIADYNKLSAWWSAVTEGTGVDLYFGQAAYRMDADDPASAWYGVSELERQAKANKSTPGLGGTIFFSFQSFLERPALAAALKALREAQDGFTTPISGGLALVAGEGEINPANVETSSISSAASSSNASSITSGTSNSNTSSITSAASSSGSAVPQGPILIARPMQNLKTDYYGIYLTGASNPDKPLLLNGTPLETRSPSGYFGVFIPLSRGKNTFVFSQEGVYAVRSVWRNKISSNSGGTIGPAKMTAIEIPASSVFPQNPLFGMPGDSYSFSCTAPIGAIVTVKIGGITLPMTPSITKKPGDGAYPTTYRATWKMPAQTGAARVVNVGAPIYRMTYVGKTKTRTAPGKVGIIMSGAPFYAEMQGNPTETYDQMSTAGGTQFYLEKGSKEAITGMYGTWVRLASGLFVKKTAVKIAVEKKTISANTTSPVYSTGAAADKFSFTLKARSAVTADFNGSALRVRVSLASSLALPALPPDGLFESVVAEKNGSGLQYVFRLRAGARLDGYALDKTENGYEIPLKRHIASVSTSQPLLGKTILLDPGHGGSNSDPAGGDTGAIGPMGLFWTERNINLSNAQILKAELERLGASVQMTRTDDVSVSLESRLAISRKLRPDLFISIHADSMEDNVDISRLSGFSVWYREPLAAGIGGMVLKNVVDTLGKKDRRLNQRNFYVTRGTWCPSILFEAGFVPNATEFESLTNPETQRRMAEAVAEAVVAWYRD